MSDETWQWQEGEYTVSRSTQWSGPGCHNGCGILYYTRDNKLIKVEGDTTNPYNNGRLCMRCLNLPEAVNHPDRLKWPLKRAGKRGENKWERISWDAAYDIIVDKVKTIKQDYGPESIIGMEGTGRNIPIGQFGIKVLEDGPRKMPDGKWDWTYLPMPTTLCNLCEARTAAGKLPSCAQHCQANIISYDTVEELSNKMNKKRKMVLYTPV